MASARAQPGQQIKAGRDLAKTGEVMLDKKGAVKAERLGLDIVVDEVSKTLAAVGVRPAAPGLRAAEQSKAHLVLLEKRPFYQVGFANARGLFFRPAHILCAGAIVEDCVADRGCPEVKPEEVLCETNIARRCAGDNDCHRRSDGRALC